MLLDEGMVTAADGMPTTTCSPHLESLVVAFVTPETIAVSVTGSVIAPVEMVRVFITLGNDVVAGIIHFSRWYVVFPVTTVDSFVAFAFGNRAATEDIVRSNLRLAYWLVPAVQDSHSVPIFFASVELIPKSVVSPEELPLTYAWVDESLTVRCAVPSTMDSVPLIDRKSVV